MSKASLATCAVEQRSVEPAREVIDGDSEIDAREVDVEEECLHMLALYQPVASDLRFIVSVLTINKDLGAHRRPLSESGRPGDLSRPSSGSP